MSKAVTNTPKKADNHVPATAFSGTQLSLFQGFLTNESTREGLSNAIDLWDSAPRYSISRQKQNELRSPDGMLPILPLEFRHRTKPFNVEIRPARIVVKDGTGAAVQDAKGNAKTIEYYPSAREEVVEHALRKLAAEENAGFYDQLNKRSGVAFTLHRLRQELSDCGHSMTYDDLVESIEILNYSSIAITEADADDNDEGKVSQPYFPLLVKINKKKRAADPDAKWFVQFHSLVAHSIDKIAYRQFNYRRLMKCRTQLARWLLCQLVIKYTQASPMATFEMKYSTIARDSNLLTGYTRARDGIAALDEAWEQLKELGAIYFAKKAEERGPRGKVMDVSYTLTASGDFVREQKAANKRATDARVVVDKAQLSFKGQVV